MRRRFTTDGKADKGQTGDSYNAAVGDDRDKHSAVSGYLKLVALIFFFTALLLIRFYVVDLATVVGDSMNDTFVQGDVLIVKKFDITEIGRYDVVIAKVGKQNMIKRVIGLPGNTVQISDGGVFVDGEAVDGKFDFHTDNAGVAREPYTLGENEYFLMGDNRSASYDSRDFGAVDLSQMSGIAVARILPIWQMEIIQK